MVGQKTLTLSAFVALAQSKAVITNLCKDDVYAWSVPQSANYAYGDVIEAGSQYVEPFHQGTDANPGIAIKLSPIKNGIYEGKEEINFSYTVDQQDHNKVWISLDKLNEASSSNSDSFFTCQGLYQDPHMPTRQCSLTDDIELVLCGTERTGSANDTMHVDKLKECALQQKVHTAAPQPRHCNGLVKRTTRSLQEATKPQEKPKSHNTSEVSRRPSPQPDANQSKNCGCGGKDCKCKKQCVGKTTCEWDTKGVNCWCDEVGQADKKRDASRSNCLTTGDFDFCFKDRVSIEERGANASTIAIELIQPAFQMLWENACLLAAIRDLDCQEFKKALRESYPGIEKDVSTVRVRASNANTTAHVARAVTPRDAESCRVLETLFAHSTEITSRNCLDILHEVRQKLSITYRKKKVFIDGLVKASYPLGGICTLVEKKLEKEYGDDDADWTCSSDDEAWHPAVSYKAIKRSATILNRRRRTLNYSISCRLVKTLFRETYPTTTDCEPIVERLRVDSDGKRVCLKPMVLKYAPQYSYHEVERAFKKHWSKGIHWDEC